MRKLLVAVTLTMIVGIAADRGRSASASQTCSATCEGGNSIVCTVASGTCSSSSGTVTCCGTTHNCNAINSWYVCFFECVHGFPPQGVSSDIKGNCSQICGAAPQTNFSC